MKVETGGEVWTVRRFEGEKMGRQRKSQPFLFLPWGLFYILVVFVLWIQFNLIIIYNYITLNSSVCMKLFGPLTFSLFPAYFNVDRISFTYYIMCIFIIVSPSANLSQIN